MTNNPSRRAVVAGALWTAPAVAVVGAAPAYAASPGCMTPQNPVEWQTINLTVYSRVRTYAKVGLIENRTDAMSRVVFTFTLPKFIRAGATVATQSIAYTSTLSTAATASAYSAGGRTVQSGWVDTSYNFGGGLTPASTPMRMSLNPGNIAIPSSGQLVTTFTGTMPQLTASTTPGTYAIVFNNPPEPVVGQASTWNGSQSVKTNIFGAVATAQVNSMVPSLIPAGLPNDWGTGGQSQSTTIATYKVIAGC